MPSAVVKDGKVQLRNGQGGAFSVPKEQVAEALRGGEFRLETPEEFEKRATSKERGTLVQRAITAAEGAARGATFGLSTAALSELGGEEYRQAATERAEENPRTALVSEIGGATLPSFLSGGAGAVGTAARLTPAALAARAATAVGRGAEGLAARAGLSGAGLIPSAARAAAAGGAAGAVETGLYGMGSDLADASLEGVDWTAERALAGLLSGASFGAGTGAAFGAGGLAAGRLAKAAAREVVDGMVKGGQTFKRAVEDWAEERAATSIAGQGDAVDDIVARVTRGGEQPERAERLSALLRERVESGTRGEISDIARREASTAAKARAAMVSELDNAGVVPNAVGIRDAVDTTVAELVETGNRAAAGRLRRAAGSTPRTMAEADRLHSDLEDVVDWARKTKSAALPELERTAERVSAHIDEAAAGISPTAQSAWSEVRKSASDWRALADHVGKQPLTDAEVGKLIGLAGTATSIATGSVLPYLGAAAVGQNPKVRQFVRERGGAALGWLASHTGWFERSANSAARRIAGGDPSGAAARALKPEATKRGILESVQTYPDRDKPKRGLLQSLQTYPAAREREQEKNISTARQYAALVAHLEQVQRNPAHLEERAARIVAPLARSQPEVAMSMARILADDQAWLASQIPQPVNSEAAAASVTPMGLRNAPKVPPSQKRKLVAYAKALSNPMSVFEGMASGRVDWAGIEALKARRPSMWEEMRERVIYAANEAGGDLPYRKRVMLGLAFDFSSDWSMSHVAEIQATGQPAAGEGASKPAVSGVSTDQYQLPMAGAGAP